MPKGRKVRGVKTRHRKRVNKIYERLRKKGYSKSKAARIAKGGKTKASHSRMAKRAARSRRRKKR
jgi:hypothetical protein